MGARRREQLEELDNFRSMLECFDGSLEYNHSDNDSPIHGKIRIDLPLLERPIVIFAEVGVEVQYREVKALEYCNMIFSLPDDYPAVSPSISIECSWMSSERCAMMNKVIEETASSMKDQEMLYSIAFAIREKACENLEKLNRVDNTPYCIAMGIDGATILHRLVEAASTIEQTVFERECHDCEVCFENEPGSRCARFLPCRHVYCDKCVQQYFVGLLKSEGIRTFECLADSCSSIAAQEVVKKAIGEEEYERYEAILLERALGAMDDMAICPRIACGKYVIVNPVNRQLGQCDACSYAFCVICRKTYHGVEGCRWQIDEKLKLLEEYEKGDNRHDLEKRAGGKDALEKMISNLRNDKWLLENSKKCPKCKTDIEKNNGCNKMKCSKCATAFCWLCLKRLDHGDPYKHFTENNGVCANRLFEGMNEDDMDEYWIEHDDDLDYEDGDSDDFDEDDYFDDNDDGEFNIEHLIDDPERLLEIMGENEEWEGDEENDPDYNPFDLEDAADIDPVDCDTDEEVGDGVGFVEDERDDDEAEFGGDNEETERKQDE
uniref:RBR-type E3 ubiquitin transferase n=1 Tax=Pristionchus pacificus TaxID=54126 RepID=A0A8R1Z9X3_PRIPA